MSTNLHVYRDNRGDRIEPWFCEGGRETIAPEMSMLQRANH